MRAEGRIDERTRLINVVVRVDAPYARRPPLAAGLFATVEIEGRRIDAAAILPRAALRAGDQVWVVDDNQRLRFRNVHVARLSKAGALIDEGLAGGERIIVSNMKAVTDGMTVRPIDPAKGGQP
jgi:hypothetical protein